MRHALFYVVALYIVRAKRIASMLAIQQGRLTDFAHVTALLQGGERHPGIVHKGTWGKIHGYFPRWAVQQHGTSCTQVVASLFVKGLQQCRINARQLPKGGSYLFQVSVDHP